MNTAKSFGRGLSIPHNTMTGLFIAMLFFLRIILAGIAPTFMKNPPAWIHPVYEVGTYFLVVVMIWWEREHLAEFFIDRLALIILILGKPYELFLHWFKIPFSYPQQSELYWLYLPTAFLLLIIVLFSHPKQDKLRGRNWMWLLVGIVAGIVSGILIGYLLRYQLPTEPGKLTPLLMIVLPTQQMVYAGIAEEPFFRGFLWGGLRRAGWDDRWILIAQTILFMIAHLYYFTRFPISFWIVVPLGGLMTGLLACRSRSIATSMAGHGCFNAVGQMVAFYRF